MDAAKGSRQSYADLDSFRKYFDEPETSTTVTAGEDQAIKEKTKQKGTLLSLAVSRTITDETETTSGTSSPQTKTSQTVQKQLETIVEQMEKKQNELKHSIKETKTSTQTSAVKLFIEQFKSEPKKETTTTPAPGQQETPTSLKKEIALAKKMTEAEDFETFSFSTRAKIRSLAGTRGTFVDHLFNEFATSVKRFVTGESASHSAVDKVAVKLKKDFTDKQELLKEGDLKKAAMEWGISLEQKTKLPPQAAQTQSTTPPNQIITETTVPVPSAPAAAPASETLSVKTTREKIEEILGKKASQQDIKAIAKYVENFIKEMLKQAEAQVAAEALATPLSTSPASDTVPTATPAPDKLSDTGKPSVTTTGKASGTAPPPTSAETEAKAAATATEPAAHQILGEPVTVRTPPSATTQVDQFVTARPTAAQENKEALTQATPTPAPTAPPPVPTPPAAPTNPPK